MIMCDGIEKNDNAVTVQDLDQNKHIKTKYK